ncbi:HEAT repeat domain-containing protein [Sphingobium sp. HWE2-09]|uniref:HEAT repeat domain-containing protein n=1 Tax=Sphingobium sp. HWE2-09 TaxID=3108390 RepID=UPI002DCDC33F|nr:HEAT repeat domain-containing protein [Sphingobium sp. HWE2-09]
MRVRKEELERIVASDPADHVRIVAAEALVGLGEPVDAVKLLAQLADDDNALAIRMQAFDELSTIGRAAILALPVLRKAANASYAASSTLNIPSGWRCI